MLVVSSEQRSQVLLNILQCTGQTPTRKKYPAQNANSAEAEEPSSWAYPKDYPMVAREFIVAQWDKMLPGFYLAYHFL